ncbi:MAG: hypothetical protein J5700_00045, partial [Treponema sp.]|nr:hypothetical protein [Treponema sp.]
KSDSNDGTAYSPFETFNKAAKVIKAVGDADTDFTIYVCGTVEGNASLPNGLNGKARSITVKGLGAIGEDSKPTAALDAKQSGRALEIKTSVPITLQNLRVTGGKVNSGSAGQMRGAGIYLGDSADLTLAGDVVVEQNFAALDGGGIYVDGTSSLKIKGAVTVWGNTHGNESAKLANNLYLFSGKKIEVLGALKTTDAAGQRKSKIGISHEDKPTVSAPTLEFTHGYTAKNAGVSPLEYFWGDKYGVASAASGEAALSLTGGNITIDPVYKDITITIDKNILPKDLSQKKFTFSASANVDGTQVAIPAGSGEGQVQYTFSVTYRGETVPQSYGGKNYYTTGTDSVTLLDVPAGSYMICATALYGGKTYSGEFEVEMIDALLLQGASGSELGDYMLDPSTTEVEVYIEKDYMAATPSFPDEEIAASGYYRNESGVWEKEYSCVIPAGKTLKLNAAAPVTISCDSAYNFFDVSGTLVIGENVTIFSSSINWNVIQIEDGGKVILDGGTITNGAGYGTANSAVTVSYGGTFVMNSGLMTGNNNTGAVAIESGGKFEMSGGEISGNTSRFYDTAGGVTIKSGGTFIKSGGTIKNNTSSGSPSQMIINAGGKYGPSESALTTYGSATEFADEF